jgi:hypothetical protein
MSKVELKNALKPTVFDTLQSNVSPNSAYRPKSQLNNSKKQFFNIQENIELPRGNPGQRFNESGNH